MVSETASSSYTATFSGACDSSGNVTVSSTTPAVCTITNTFVPPPTTGSIEILKDVVAPNGGAATDATTFTVTLSGPGEFSTSTTFGEGLSAIFANLLPGSYTVGEIAQTGYQLIGISPATTTTVSVGATTTVTVTNRQISNTGELTVLKVVDNDGNGNATKEAPSDFNLYVDGVLATSGVATTTAATSHTVTEDPVEGYQASWSENCPGGVISVPAEGSVTCTLTNTWVGTGKGQLIVDKVVVGGELSSADFDLFVDGVSVTDETATTTVVGPHTVTESSEANDDYYVASWSENCPDGVVNVVSDESVTCTLTNTYTPPTTGTVVVTKNVIGSDYETDVEDGSTFTVTLTAGEFSTSSAFGEGAAATFQGLTPGDYSVAELAKSGYDLVSVSPATATVVAGQTVNVTVTNRQRSSSGGLVIVKNVVDANGNEVEDATSFTVVLGGEMSVSIGEGAPAELSGLSFGEYSVSENARDGYELVSISPSVATVSPEGTTTVTVTNRQTSQGSGEQHRPRRGGHRHPGGSVLGASTDGEVLGASTDSCEMYLTDYIWRNRPNNPAQVMKLQEFLNKVQNAGLAVNGEYDAATRDAVGKYQVANWEKVLAPWFGSAEPHVPTYNVYKTTRWLINETECPGAEAYPQI